MKRILAICMLLAMLICMLLPINTSAEESSVRSNRIVSIVYDDSGSMFGDNWVYANYAMQNFAAMLNEGDTLYITYMSDPGRSVALNTSDLPDAVNAIRNHDIAGATPFASMDTAFNTLTSVTDSYPSTQYWLVTFTDGGFNETSSKDDVTQKLSQFAATDMPNGTKPYIYFMTIDDQYDVYTPSAGSNTNVEVAKSLSVDDITESIFGISSKISGRFRVDQKDITKDGDKSIKVHADLPLFNIGVLTQNTSAKVEKVTDSENQEIPIKSNVDVQAPGPSDVSGAEGASDEAVSLHGNATLAGKEREIIPAGEYTVTFSDQIDEKDYVVLLEPAIELRLTLSKDGKEITDYSGFTENESGITAKAELYEFGTDTPILPSLLPGNIRYSVTHSERGIKVKDSQTNELSEIALTTGESIISAEASLPDYFSLSCAVSFTPTGVRIDKIEAEIVPDGSERLKDSQGNPDGDDVIYLSKMRDSKTGVKFILYEDGEPIDEARAISLKKDFEKGLRIDYKGVFSGYKVEVQPDGSYLVAPNVNPDWQLLYNSLISYVFNHGPREFKSTAFDTEASETLTFKLGPFDPWDILRILLPLYIIIWVLVKKGFPREKIEHRLGIFDENDFEINYNVGSVSTARLRWYGVKKQRGMISILGNVLKFISLAPASAKFHGFVFEGQSHVLPFWRTDEILVKNVNEKMISKNSSDPSKKYKEKDMKLSLNEKFYYFDGASYHRFNYK